MKYHILLGGNLGNRIQTLTQATEQISKRVGSILQKSSIYETKAWGVENQPDFLNQVIVVDSSLSPQETLKENLQIEKELGRTRHQKWHERTIDIDILYAEGLVIDEENLKIPHPFIQERKFTLVPLEEISADFVHPVLQKTQKHLNKLCKDSLPVIVFVQ
ncbi:MAG: 2-amino-4-hydroxy-6-hydroxymethyldihydropteridine diphosphokinase [Cytophagales bacterium]|nr:2-amino-4-hydroxy-6-hydroxymethyldihydropteridine diphosphokinase [Cytophagales bacterium]